eukprot:scaffold354_cov116-Isochrysis_galbana.AAC.18
MCSLCYIPHPPSTIRKKKEKHAAAEGADNNDHRGPDHEFSSSSPYLSHSPSPSRSPSRSRKGKREPRHEQGRRKEQGAQAAPPISVLIAVGVAAIAIAGARSTQCPSSVARIPGSCGPDALPRRRAREARAGALR